VKAAATIALAAVLFAIADEHWGDLLGATAAIAAPLALARGGLKAWRFLNFDPTEW
jgi:hypothetical protein